MWWNDDQSSFYSNFAENVFLLLELLFDRLRGAIDETKGNGSLAISNLVGEDTTPDLDRSLCATLCTPTKRLENRLRDFFFDKWSGVKGLPLQHPCQGTQLLLTKVELEIGRLTVFWVSSVTLERERRELNLHRRSKVGVQTP